MITRQVTGNIFSSGCRNIAFGINVEGHNHEGFAGMIAGKYWRALGHTGRRRMGEVLSHITPRFTFHAMVCHYAAPGGFIDTPDTIITCLDAIEVPDTEEIASVMVGGGPIGRLAGADVRAILRGIQNSRKRVAVYSLG